MNANTLRHDWLMTLIGLVLIGLVLIGLAMPGQIAWAEGEGDSAQTLPPSHYIEGVPFVSWGEAARQDYDNKNILNPYLPAASQMLARYRGVEFDAATGRALQEVPNEAYDLRKGARLDDLKRFIADDLPVQVTPALTAHTHYLYITLKLMSRFSDAFDVDLEQPGPTSGMFPEMTGIDAFMEAVAQGCDPRIINDSVFLASRIVVGYDDERGVLLIHDPVYGPDWEISYDDFMNMWRFDGNDMWTLRLTDAEGNLVRAPADVAHPPRTVDHDAAFALFNGYSLAAVDRLDEAERELRRGVALEGASPRYAHLLRLELGSLLGKTRRREEALTMLEESIRIYPHYFRAWGELGNVYKSYGDRKSREKAKKAYKKMESLCTEKTERRVAKELGQDFFVVGCKGAYLGWMMP